MLGAQNSPLTGPILYPELLGLDVPPSDPGDLLLIAEYEDSHYDGGNVAIEQLFEKQVESAFIKCPATITQHR